MLYIKKYWSEGLIQVALLLSLCGLRLHPSLPLSWREIILGPTSALTPVQFHNLRNQLEDGHDLPPKTADLDAFFTSQRLRGLLRSLDRLQVPPPELETWLVQRESAPLVAGRPEQLPPVMRGAEALEQEQEQTAPYASPRAVPLHDDELNNNDDDDDKELRGEAAVLEQQPSEMQPRVVPTDHYSQELELHWQDLLAIMEPENRDGDTTALSDSEARAELSRGTADHEIPTEDSDQEVPQTEAPLQSGLMWPSRFSELQHPLLPLIPSTNLDDQNSAVNERDTLKTMNGDADLSPPDHMGLLAEEPLEDLCMGENTSLNLHPFSMSMPLEDSADCVESCTCPRYHQSPETRFDFNFQSLSLRESDMTQDILASPSAALLEDSDVEDQRSLPSPLNDFLEANAILDEMSWLDGVLEEGLSAEMVATFEEDINLDGEIAQQFTDSMSSGEDEHRRPREAGSEEEQREAVTHQQDNEEEADSDSGLSLDFSQEPQSPCVSEASSYSSSSCSSSDSSSSSLSVAPSVFSEDEDEEYAASYMEVTFKQEEQEEEMGAVGGFLPDVNKFVGSNYGDHKLFNGFPWLENIGHDHTYTQPRSSSNSPSTCKMAAKYPKSNLKHDTDLSSRHISQTKLWNRDERRARTLKIPFSNELIVNMPVEDFNDLLSNHQLSEQQLTLVRDIRRRGKNKIAAQNCRKRKLGVLLGLEEDVSGLKRRRLQLLKQKQEVMKNLQEMRWRLNMLQQEVFSRLRDEGEGGDDAHDLLQFGANGTVTVAPQQQGPPLPRARDRARRKQKDKKN